MRRRSNNGGAGGCARSSDKMVVSFSPPLSSFSLPVTGKEKEGENGGVRGRYGSMFNKVW